jgi:hypothetical protein
LFPQKLLRNFCGFRKFGGLAPQISEELWEGVTELLWAVFGEMGAEDLEAAGLVVFDGIL